MNFPIVDTHQHLIYSDKWTYSWTEETPALAGKAFRLDDYVREIEGTDIQESVFMETTPDAWREEAALVAGLGPQPGLRIAGFVANGHPEQAGFDEYVESIQSDRLVGLRRICHVEDDEFSRQPRFVQNLGRIGRYGLTFDLCFLARQLPIAMELAAKCPNTQFILDHCGVPDIAGGGIDPWRDHMRRLAALPNVACKISGVLAYCTPGGATVEAVRPYVEPSIECFGWDRVVWGSDWPVCTVAASLREWIAISFDIVSAVEDSGRRKRFRENAIHIYGLKVNEQR